MKKLLFSLLTLLITATTYAYDIAVKNADGVMIYYNFINDGKELEVAKGSYKGGVVIPNEVTYTGATRKVTSSGEWAINSCSSLTSVTMSNNVTSIGEQAFSYSGLTSITIPNSVKSIGSYAFYWCRALASLTIPEGVINVGIAAFSECTSLTSATIPNSVTSIGESAFNNCYILTSATITSGLTRVANAVFYG